MRKLPRRTRLAHVALGVLLAASCGGTEEGATTNQAGQSTPVATTPVATSQSLGAPAISGGATPQQQAAAGESSAAPSEPEGAEVVPPPTSRPTVDSSVLPAPDGPSATAIVLQEAEPRITAVVYPRPDYEGNPWSQWGQGVVLPNGRVVSAIGDHLGRDGNSYVFVFDPATGVMTRVGDVATAIGQPAGSWGYGKVHGQMVLADDGDVYFATYWGSRRDLEFDDVYQGDVLFRIHTDTFELVPLGVPVPLHGIPSLAGDGRYLFGEALDPFSKPASGGLVVYDTVDEEVETWLPDDRHAQFRNVIVDRTGAMVASADGGLLRYEIGAEELERSPISLGDRLRASTRPDASGVVYVVTNEDDRLFAIAPDGTTRDLGTTPEYTASLALVPDESAFLYVPGAHGNAPKYGTPVIAVDVATGEQTTIAELDQLARDRLGLVLGGSYNVTVDPQRGLAHIGFNAGPTDESPWGEVVLVTVELDEGSARVPGPDRSGVASVEPADPANGAFLEPATDAYGLVEPLTGMRGHAVAVADVNGDGWHDLFVGTFADRRPQTYAVRGADGPAPDRLLLGGPDGFSLDETFPGRRSRSAGAAFADLDGDGDPDLIISRNVRKDAYGTEILRNDNGTFVSMGELDGSRGGRAVGTLDYDGDGDLDVFLVEDRWSGASSVLYRNDGRLRFSDRTSAAGLPIDVFGLGLGIADLDGNGTDDIIVGGSNRIFLGDGDGRFVESVGTDLTWDTFGDEDDVAHVAVGDLNADGRPDIVFGQHYNSTIDFDEEVPVRLYLNEGTDARGSLVLRDVTDEAGLIGLPTKAPKVVLLDVNADGLLDIVTTASAEGGSQPAVFLHRGVIDGVPRFTSPDGLGDAQYWIDAAVLDVDRDGHDDLFLVEWEPKLPSPLFRNGAS